MNDKVLKNFDSEIKKKAKSREMFKFIFTDDEGKDVEYEILATFRNKKTKRIYYIMTDNTRSSNNELNISFYYIDYTEDDSDINVIDNSFYAVESEDEIKMIMEVFNKIKADL